MTCNKHSIFGNIQVRLGYPIISECFNCLLYRSNTYTFLLVKSNNFLNDYNFLRLSVKMLYVGAEKCAKRNCQKENVKLDCQLTCGECTPANITTLPPTNITTLAPTSNTTTPKVINYTTISLFLIFQQAHNYVHMKPVLCQFMSKLSTFQNSLCDTV